MDKNVKRENELRC